MKQYSTFIFEAYTWSPETGTVELTYSLDGEVKFSEKLIFPVGAIPMCPQSEIDAALFALHLIGGISYYKTCLPKKIEIRSGTLSEEQAEFWNTVYENGLGEFFFKNQIDFRGLIQFPSDVLPPSSVEEKTQREGKKRVLVPVGGGKDSVVTMELLKKSGADCTLFRLGHHPLITKVAEVAGLPLMTVERHLSPNLFKLNEQGALNGHIPITAYLSFVTILLSLLYDFDAVAMSNEKSASYGNVEFHGKEINHQWSKSQEFEEMFQDYVQTFISKGVQYGSELREKSELEVAGIFTKYPQYLSVTTSCNTNWRIVKEKPKELWCSKCPKCAFVFALFAAYLPKATLVEMFGKNLFDDVSLIPLYQELLGIQGFKPFECVGTPEETTEAFTLAHKRGEFEETPVMKMFLSTR